MEPGDLWADCAVLDLRLDEVQGHWAPNDDENMGKIWENEVFNTLKYL
jgi:hypothetical protein